MRPSVGLSDKIKHWKIWRKPFGLIEVRTVQIQWTSPVMYTTISKLVSVTKLGYTCWLKLCAHERAVLYISADAWNGRSIYDTLDNVNYIAFTRSIFDQ